MSYVLVDLYGDGESLRLFPDDYGDGLDRAIAEFNKQDELYTDGVIDDDVWQGFDGFMRSRGYQSLPLRMIAL